MKLPTPIPLASLHERPWENGDGTGTTIAAGPDPQDWRWHISISQLQRDGRFIPNPDTQRLLVPLDAPLRIEDSYGRWQNVRRHKTIQFDGRPEFAFHLPEGPTRIFKLMLREGYDGELQVRPLSGPLPLPSFGSADWFVHILSGRARLRRHVDERALDVGDSIGLAAAAGVHTQLDGDGDVALIRLTKNTSGLSLQMI